MKKEYLIPKQDIWHTEVKRTNRKPNILCKECKYSSWCKDAPWVSGCNVGVKND